MVRGGNFGIGASDDRRSDWPQINTEVLVTGFRVTQSAEMEDNS